MRRSLLLACLLPIIASCSQNRAGSTTAQSQPTTAAQDLTVTFTGRRGAPSGQTTVAAVPGNQSGDIAVSLDGISYTGRWTYEAAPVVGVDPAMGLGPGQSSAPGQSDALATGAATPIATGDIVIAGTSGARLRCTFNYSAGSSAGFGECHDDKGRAYDLEITR